MPQRWRNGQRGRRSREESPDNTRTRWRQPPGRGATSLSRQAFGTRSRGSSPGHWPRAPLTTPGTGGSSPTLSSPCAPRRFGRLGTTEPAHLPARRRVKDAERNRRLHKVPLCRRIVATIARILPVLLRRPHGPADPLLSDDRRRGRGDDEEYRGA